MIAVVVVTVVLAALTVLLGLAVAAAPTIVDRREQREYAISTRPRSDHGP